jgi:6-phosphogluconolactonase/glucosamine-6-phosphate isomerase/deaminase
VDGHTASLLPGDAAVDELRRYVALSGAYKGYRRLTLTRPVLDRAQLVVWLVRGAEKAEPLGRLLAGDLSIPAGLIRPRQSIVIADADAARQF